MSAVTNYLRATIHFVAWRNFVDPRVWLLWLAWMAALVIFVTVALAAGGLVAGRRRTYASAADAFVLETTAGLALLSVCLFVLALAGWYRPSAVLTLAVALLALPAVLERDLRAARRPFGRLAAAFAERRWIVLVLLPWTIPAFLPPIRWDEMSFHLAYADEWIRAGGLTVDPYMRYPLAAFNWQMLQGAALMTGSETLPHLLTWLAGLLAALTVDQFLRRLDVSRQVRVTAVVALVLTPLVQRYIPLGMIDLPLMAMLAVAVYALLELRDRAAPAPRDVVPAALSAAMFVGMKVLVIAYVPLFLALAALRLWRQRPALAAYVVVFAVAGSLWYVRNLIIAGDPAPPLFSGILGIPAMHWSAADQALQRADIVTGLSWAPGAIARLPLRLLTTDVNGVLRDVPMLGYVLLFPFSLLLAGRLWRARMIEPLAAAWFGVAVWLATTYHIRYATFLPLMVVCAAALLDAALSRLRIGPRTGAVIAVLLLVGPTPAAIRYTKGAFADRIPIGESERAAWERVKAPDLPSLDALTRVAPAPRRVYSLGVTPLKYYFQRDGYAVMGDYFHDGRYTDLRKAFDAGTTRQWLRGFHADVLVLTSSVAAHELGIPEDSVADELARRAGLPVLARGDGWAILDIPQ